MRFFLYILIYTDARFHAVSACYSIFIQFASPNGGVAPDFVYKSPLQSFKGVKFFSVLAPDSVFPTGHNHLIVRVCMVRLCLCQVTGYQGFEGLFI
jgi:hypothetical protein